MKKSQPSKSASKPRHGPARGRFLTFEGPEGCGKTTLAREIVDRLKTLGEWVVTLREPGGTATGEAIRNLLQHDAAAEPISPEAETLLFEASRAQLCHRVIRPALEAGAWVICDRFFDSTTAYQGYGRGMDVESLLNLHEFAVAGLRPDRTFLLDLDVASGFQRLGRRQAAEGTGPDRMEREDIAFHERVRQGYLDLARRWPERIVVVDARLDAASMCEKVWENIRDAGLLPS